MQPFVLPYKLTPCEIAYKECALYFRHLLVQAQFIFWIINEFADCRWYVEFAGRNLISVLIKFSLSVNPSEIL